MRHFKHVLLIAFIISCLAAFSHDFYVSICQIDYNPKTESLEITLKIFTDDLEKALETQGTGTLHLGTDKEPEEADDYISAYLQKNFRLILNGDTVAMEYLGKEVEIEATWCYIEIPYSSKVKTLQVRNHILMEIYDNQTNIVHVKSNGRQKSLLLSKSNPEDKVKF